MKWQDNIAKRRTERQMRRCGWLYDVDMGPARHRWIDPVTFQRAIDAFRKMEPMKGILVYSHRYDQWNSAGTFDSTYTGER